MVGNTCPGTPLCPSPPSGTLRHQIHALNPFAIFSTFFLPKKSVKYSKFVKVPPGLLLNLNQSGANIRTAIAPHCLAPQVVVIGCVVRDSG